MLDIILSLEEIVYCNSILQNKSVLATDICSEPNQSNQLNIENQRLSNEDFINSKIESLAQLMRKFVYETDDIFVIKNRLKKVQLHIIELLTSKQSDIQMFNYFIVNDDHLRVFTLKKLDEYLYYMEKIYFEFIDESLRCSKQSRNLKGKEIISNAKKIEDSIEDQSFRFNYKNVLSHICDFAILKINDKNSSLTSLKNCSKVLVDLNAIVSINKNDHNFIKNYLLKVNYPEQIFLNALLHEIKESCIQEDSTLSILVNYKSEIRNYSQMNLNRNEFIFPHENTIKSLVLEFINAEIIYFEFQNLIETNTQKDAFPKIFLNLSVEQISAFLKILVSCRLILEDNKQVLFRKIALYFSSVNETQITAKSLSAKYYGVTPISLDFAKSILFKLIKQFNK